MSSLRADRWFRVGAGCVLLLLLAAQEKVCASLLNPPSSTAHDADCSGGNRGREGTPDTQRNKRKKTALPFLLPDTTLPRWPASWSQVTLRQTAHVRDGVADRGPRNPADDATSLAQLPAHAAPSWRVFQLPLTPPRLAHQYATFTVARDPATRTSISRTGPPRR